MVHVQTATWIIQRKHKVGLHRQQVGLSSLALFAAKLKFFDDLRLIAVVQNVVAHHDYVARTVLTDGVLEKFGRAQQKTQRHRQISRDTADCADEIGRS